MRAAAIFFSIWLIVLTASAAQTGPQSNIDFGDPNRILAAVESHGPERVVDQANTDWLIMHGVLKKIATGQKPWLEVAVRLRPGANRATVLLFQYSVGEALGNAPENVFRISSEESFGLLDVCGMPDTDDIRFDSHAEAKAELDRRRQRIGRVSGEQKPAAEKCLEYLKDADAQLAQFFHIGASRE